MDREAYLRRWQALHGGAHAGALVRGWLSGAHAIARPLAGAGVPPAAVTLAGAALAVAAAVVAVLGGRGGGAAVAAGVLIAVAGVFDNLDGAVAVMTGRTSARGALLDATLDRVGDAACAVVLWACGAPAWLALLAGALAQLQEYVRARGQGLGVDDVGVVSVAERPVRLAIAAASAVATAIVVWLDWATLGAAVWAVLGVIGLVQVVTAVGRRV
ncbi:CDP-alcohol phosphatidyltransferase family protein [Kineococcus rhizosphaerae]|uniref:CDP-diacylglycerol--glycerol-3-phosphate 3-phosphatidyltransferase n=1 Tax=Kineococcus rhizosphaerae TaxID=559628 RepID=A0A2T0R8K2_9ACTN|nr:CDP-alcohol phosphatidyltransferase family protein [Kineococcus rhizosphaerae]PRY17505.1 CDP-diacylglycerol--glycerol-3-phosphate 3-phosphatidyltransferase [Kineococcus rhizosphaerae]